MLGSSAETIGAYNTGFDTGNMYPVRPTVASTSVGPPPPKVELVHRSRRSGVGSLESAAVMPAQGPSSM